MDSKFIILANGEIENPEYLANRLKSWGKATVVAADGGLLHAESLGLSVDHLIGDLDSVNDDMVNALGQAAKVQKFPEAKDETDLELALIYAANAGAQAIVLLGALGGRVDMSLANILLLTMAKLNEIHVELWSGVQTAWLLRPPGGDIYGKPGDTVSLIPLLGKAEGITTANLAYPLTGSTLHAGEIRGVSNVLTDANGHIKIEMGTVLVVHTQDRA